MKRFIDAKQIAYVMVAAFTLAAMSDDLSASDATDNPFELVQSLAERLDTAEQVALNKWDTGQPVFDPQREAQVIARAAAMAGSYGLTAEDATDVFMDQIEANKEIQYALLNRWRRHGSAPDTPRQSLPDVIRPKLDKLQPVILQHLQQLGPLRRAAPCQREVALAVGQVAQERSLDTLHIVALDRAAARICLP